MPGAADVVVLVEHDIVDPGLVQAMPGEDARHARTDDHGAEVAIGREVGLVPPRRPSVLASVGELLLQQWQVLAHVGAADRELEDLLQVGIGRRRRRHTTAIAIRGEHTECELADLRLLLVGETALRHRREQRVGPEVIAQQRQVAGQVRERRQQRRQLGHRQCGPDLAVRCDDRFDARDEGARRARRRAGRARHAVLLGRFAAGHVVHSLTPFGAFCPMKPNM